MELALRPYQAEAVDSFFSSLTGHRRQLLTLATGLGKTVVFGAIARRWHEQVDSARPIVVMAHRTELLEQAARTLAMVWPGVRTGYVQGERNEQNAPVLLCSTQTLVAGRRVPEPGLVIYDESHHARADGSMQVLERLGVFREGGPALLGVTATPYRADGHELGDVFTHVTYEMTILDGILQRYLTDVRGKRVEIPDLDLKRLRLVAGDYNQKDLSIAMNAQAALEAVVEAVKAYAVDRKSILFAVDVTHAHALARRFVAAGMQAAAVDGTMGDGERHQVLANFAAGKLQVLVNCQILTEGFDEPSVDCVVIARPTRSRSLYVQMVGRSLRLYPGKEHALVLDLTGASDDKSLQTFTRLMRTQDKPKKASEAQKALEEDAKDWRPDETVLQWQTRLAEVDAERKARLEQEARDVNLFADRSRFRWARVGDSFAISFGDERWAYLLRDEVGWWPVLEVEAGKLLPLYDAPVGLGYAQGVTEAYLSSLGEREEKLIDKEADWREAPLTDRQKHVLDKYRIAYDANWTRGMATDELGKRFAKRRLKDVSARWDPAKFRGWLEDERLRQRYEQKLASLRRA